MSSEAPVLRMTHAEYCAFEREASIKHEYIAGEVFAMAGGSPEHSLLAGKVIQQLWNKLEGKPCRVFTSDARIRIEAVDADVYPDAFVICGPAQRAEADSHALLNPTLVVEVLSPSTEAYDRGLKASYYRRIESLRAILFVAQDRSHLELHVRNAEGRWMLSEAGPGQRLPIDPLFIELEVDPIYSDAV
jgi:Uma2 family endonuclease